MVIAKYTPTAIEIIRMEPAFFARFPNRMENGTATTCVTSRARIMPMVPRPSVVP